MRKHTTALKRALKLLPSCAGRSKPSERLLKHCYAPAEAPASPRLRGTVLRTIKLRCKPARSSAAGERAYRVDIGAEFFLRLGWLPIPFLQTICYMRAPEQFDGDTSLVLTVPSLDQLAAFAYRKAAAGKRWQGTLCHWPAEYEPPTFSRQRIQGLAPFEHPLTDGSRHNEYTWRDISSPARFTLGHFGIWEVQIAWANEPLISERIGGERTAALPLYPTPVFAEHRGLRFNGMPPGTVHSVLSSR